MLNFSLSTLRYRIQSLAGRPFAKGGFRKGMTLIEIIIVVALLATLVSYLVSNIMDTAESAKEDQTKLAFGQLAQKLQLYKVHNNQYPTTQQGLDALLKAPDGAKRWRGPYAEDNKLNDPWGNKIDYTSDGRSFQLASGGRNGVVGDEDDILYPEKSEAPGAAPAPAE